MKMSPQTLAFLQRVLTKLNEKSSVYGYLMLFASYLAVQHRGDLANIASIVSATSGIGLFILSDAQVRAWLTGEKPSLPPPTVPEDQKS
ncbi:hypothetical protein ISN76_13000 [Dyella halodurans]|uniref:Uncharacterized protein n=1 Tax=Dyella halodurans TaxID=1920171 RepID=A0ABV9C0A0_9GAMM|nr:hypothetical protein [Dyella halodurans]